MTEDRSLDAATQGEVAWIQVDLDAIAHNARALKGLIGERVQLMAVVKANAYGHGAVPVARAALEAGASRLGVARVAEGVELQRSGIAAPIVLLGYTPASAASVVVEHRLTPAVTTLELARALSAEVERTGAAPLPIHVKVDTGMGRLGLFPQNVVSFARAVSALPGLQLEGLFTHFATADAADKSYARHQHGLFMGVLEALRQAGFRIPLAHEANSAATLSMLETHLDMVRCGIALYGLQPSAEFAPAIPLRPALSLHGRVSRVATLPAGATVSYGCTYVTQRPMRVALVPLGYGDGLHRLLSNRGAVLIRGKRCPILGRVCMDQLVVDAEAVPDVHLEDEVVALGRQGNEHISAEQVAGWAETINYEVTTSLLPRLPRVYLRARGVVEVLAPLAS